MLFTSIVYFTLHELASYSIIILRISSKRKHCNTLYSMLMEKLKCAPINLYYDITPTYRIEQVVTQDLGDSVKEIWESVNHMAHTVFQVVFILTLVV
jgi:hypothetical protein